MNHNAAVLTDDQQHLAEKEFTANCPAAVWWLYGKLGGALQENRDEKFHNLSISLWKACRHRQLEPHLKKYSVLQVFRFQARADYSVKHRHDSMKFGIKTRDAYKSEFDYLREINEVEFNDVVHAPHCSHMDDPVHHAEVQADWEALTPLQREFVQLKIAGNTHRQTSKLMHISDRKRDDIVIDLKERYGVER